MVSSDVESLFTSIPLDECIEVAGLVKKPKFSYLNLQILLPPFSLIRDFRKQNTRGNVSKISVNQAVNHKCYRQIGSDRNL